MSTKDAIVNYWVNVYKRKARLNGRLGYLTPNSKEYDKTVVDFISNADNSIIHSWMPRNADVIKIVQSLLNEVNSTIFRNDLIKMGIIGTIYKFLCDNCKFSYFDMNIIENCPKCNNGNVHIVTTLNVLI